MSPAQSEVRMPAGMNIGGAMTESRRKKRIMVRRVRTAKHLCRDETPNYRP